MKSKDTTETNKIIENGCSFIQLALTPLALGAVLTVPSYIMIQSRTSNLGSVGAIRSTGIMKVYSTLYGSVTAKQTTRSASSLALKGGSIEEKNLMMFSAIGLETFFSGINGVIAGLSKGKLPAEKFQLANPINFTRASAKYLPYTAMPTFMASSLNCISLAYIKPFLTQKSKQFTDSTFVQQITSVLGSSIVAGVLTTPINTIGTRYVNELNVILNPENGAKFTLEQTKSLFQTVRSTSFKQAIKPTGVTVGMTAIAFGTYSAIEAISDTAKDTIKIQQ